MEQLTVDQWHERILAGWAKWGNGTELDPRTVDSLAVEFAKPLMVRQVEMLPFPHEDEQGLLEWTRDCQRIVPQPPYLMVGLNSTT